MNTALPSPDTNALLARCTIPLPKEPPEWVHLLPTGRVEASDGRAWVNDDPAAVLAASLGDRPLVIDYEHQTDHAPHNGQPAPAAGWITALEVRPAGEGLAPGSAGLWGRVDWTERATAHIRAGEYRYLSPVFTHTPDSPTCTAAGGKPDAGTGGETTAPAPATAADGGCATVGRLLRAALTNDPALTLVALARTRAPDIPGGTGTGESLVTLAAFHELADQLKALKAERDAERAAVVVETAIRDRRATPAERQDLLALARTDPDRVRSLVDSRSPILASDIPAATTAVGRPGAPLTHEELAVCRAMAIAPDAFRKAKEES